MPQVTRRPIVRSDREIAAAMETWGAAVYRFALVSTGSPFDADDVYQDVFLRFATDGTVFADDAHLRSWLLRVTANRCRDLHRTPWRRRSTDPRVLETLEGTDEQTLLDSLAQRDLWRAVERLAPKERSAVHLVYGEGLSCEQAAQILGVRSSTLRTRLQRARAHLKNLLGEGWI